MASRLSSPSGEAALGGAHQAECILEQLPVGLVIADLLAGSATYANRAWTSMTGQDARQWPGQGWFDVLDPSIRADCRAQMLGGVMGGRSFQTEWPVIGAGRQPLNLRVHAAPLLVDGRKVGWSRPLST